MSTGTVLVMNPQRHGQRRAVKIESRSGPWAIYWDYSSDIAALADGEVTEDVPPSWLERKFLVSDLLEAQLGPGPYSVAPRTARDSARFHGDDYPALLAGRTTNFDFSGALVADGALKEKLLFEYKYAKSSNDNSIDGNAHERLGFQVLQYVEIAFACRSDYIALFDCFAYFLLDGSLPPVEYRQVRERN